MNKMNSIYTKNWGILIGKFDEKDLKSGKDREVLKEYQKEFPEYKYTNTKIIKEHNVRKLAVYICSLEDFKVGF